jgi:hypothetical protein
LQRRSQKAIAVLQSFPVSQCTNVTISGNSGYDQDCSRSDELSYQFEPASSSLDEFMQLFEVAMGNFEGGLRFMNSSLVFAAFAALSHSAKPFFSANLEAVHSFWFTQPLLDQRPLLSSQDGQLFHFQQLFNSNVTIEMTNCAFIHIKTSLAFGAAFFAVSEDHTLSISDSGFFDCQSLNSGKIGRRLTPVGGGAFVFSGAASSTSRSCFVRCSSVSNTQTLHIYIHRQGSNQLDECFFFRNGGCAIKSHSLFSLDRGACTLNLINASHNHISGGYAGGHIGWFSSPAKIEQCTFERNAGKSIFGSCTSDPVISENRARSVMFIGNSATKYGIYLAHSGTVSITNALFMKNTGRIFYGQAPISLHDCFFDSSKPRGNIQQKNVVWNSVDQKKLRIGVPGGIPKWFVSEDESLEELLHYIVGDVEDLFRHKDNCPQAAPPTKRFVTRNLHKIKVFFQGKEQTDPYKLLGSKSED